MFPVFLLFLQLSLQPDYCHLPLCFRLPSNQVLRKVGLLIILDLFYFSHCLVAIFHKKFASRTCTFSFPKLLYFDSSFHRFITVYDFLDSIYKILSEQGILTSLQKETAVYFLFCKPLFLFLFHDFFHSLFDNVCNFPSCITFADTIS